MKVALYARVSSDSQDTDLSLSAQLRALQEYAARQAHEVVRSFIDEAESGRTVDRPAFREMIALAKTKNLLLKLSWCGSLTALPGAGPIQLLTRHCCATRVLR